MSAADMTTLAQTAPRRPGPLAALGDAIAVWVLLWVAALVAYLALSPLDIDWLGAVADRVVGPEFAWPPFTGPGSVAAAGNVAVGVLVTAIVGFVLHLLRSGRERADPQLAFAATGIAVTITMVAGTQRSVGLLWMAGVLWLAGDRPRLPLPAWPARIWAGLLVATVAVSAAVVVAAAAAQPLRIDPSGSPTVELSALRPSALPAGDRVDDPGLLHLHVANDGPRTLRLTGVGGYATGPVATIVGLRGTPEGTYQRDDPFFRPFRPLTLSPGESAFLDVIVGLACDARLFSRDEDLRLDFGLAGGGTTSLSIAPGALEIGDRVPCVG